jgi:hypothetical protein
MLEKISQIGRDFGMIASRKRLERNLRTTSRDIVMNTWLLSVRQRREKKIVIAKRVTMMEDHCSQGRRT